MGARGYALGCTWRRRRLLLMATFSAADAASLRRRLQIGTCVKTRTGCSSQAFNAGKSCSSDSDCFFCPCSRPTIAPTQGCKDDDVKMVQYTKMTCGAIKKGKACAQITTNAQLIAIGAHKLCGCSCPVSPTTTPMPTRAPTSPPTPRPTWLGLTPTPNPTPTPGSGQGVSAQTCRPNCGRTPQGCIGCSTVCSPGCGPEGNTNAGKLCESASDCFFDGCTCASQGEHEEQSGGGVHWVIIVMGVMVVAMIAIIYIKRDSQKCFATKTSGKTSAKASKAQRKASSQGNQAPQVAGTQLRHLQDLALALQPVVVLGGAHVAAGYRERVLRPTKRRAGGGPVWGEEGLYLYFHPGNSKWFLHADCTPDADEHTCKACIAGAAAAPPLGERVWQLGKGFTASTEPWVQGALTLLGGDDAAARAAVGVPVQAVGELLGSWVTPIASAPPLALMQQQPQQQQQQQQMQKMQQQQALTGVARRFCVAQQQQGATTASRARHGRNDEESEDSGGGEP